MIGLADRGVEHATVQGQRRCSRIEASAAIEFERAPGDQALLPEQLPEAARVTRNPEGLLRRPAGRLMLAMAVARRAAENADDDLGTKPPDHANHVLEDGVPGPMLPGLIDGFGEAEIIGPGEVLPCSIEPAGRKQLLGPDQTQRLAQLGSDQVLAAFTPVEREVGSLGAHPPDQDG